jgi:hypothetical protein
MGHVVYMEEEYIYAQLFSVNLKLRAHFKNQSQTAV